MCQEVQNYQLQSWLKRRINTLPLHQQIKLKNLAKCSHNVLPHNVARQGKQAVFLLSNGEQSRFFGHLTCKNTWACPVCTARVMEKRRQRIAAALNALEKQLFAFSVTFTIPHLNFQSCHEVTDILYQTWKDFNTYKSYKKHKQTEIGVPIQEFFSKIKHYVRVAEYTHGENGWHPHFHFIFWTDFESAKTILNYRDKLVDSWRHVFCNTAQKYWKKNNLTRNIEGFKNLFKCDDQRQIHTGIAPSSLYFSINKDGSLYRVRSSNYIAGWGGDSEATGARLKTAHDGHLTQWQILEKAPYDENYAKLYIEFCLEVTTYVHKRVALSKGLSKIIDDYIEKYGYESIIKKKCSEDWKVLLWFTKEQWYEICNKNLHYPILSNILFLATKAATNLNWRDILEDYIVAEIGEVFLPSSHSLSQLVQDIYNNKAA